MRPSLRAIVWQARLNALRATLPSPLVVVGALLFVLNLALPAIITRLSPFSFPELPLACDAGPVVADTEPFMGVYFEKPKGGSPPYQRIFGFAEFIAALALLVVLYTIADVRYKFRLRVTPAHLGLLTYALLVLIG